MSLAYIVKFRVNRSLYERLSQEAQSMGFKKTADYIRNRLFGPALIIETLLKENNTMLKEICQKQGIATPERKNNKPQHPTPQDMRSRVPNDNEGTSTMF